MARVDMMKEIIARNLSAQEFSWERILPPAPLLSFIGMSEIAELNQIATSVRLSSKPKMKYQYIDNILIRRGFKKMASGTNRVVYKYLEDQSIVLKVALDKVGMGDNPAEFRNQFKLKPFCTKMFDLSPCGTVALVERVEPITSREEFMAIAPQVFNMITTKFIGKYVLNDIGTEFFQNYGIRIGMGPVLLDYPYVYELDGAKLFCNVIEPSTGIPCGGAIDYDAGFNILLCEKCKKQYFPRQLAKSVEGGTVILSKGDVHKMKISLKRGNKTVATFTTTPEVDNIPVTNNVHKNKVKVKGYQSFNARQSVKDMKGEKDHPTNKKKEFNENISTKEYGGNLKGDTFKNNKKTAIPHEEVKFEKIEEPIVIEQPELKVDEHSEVEIAAQVADRYIAIQETELEDEKAYKYSIIDSENYKVLTDGFYTNMDNDIRKSLNHILMELSDDSFDDGVRGSVMEDDEPIYVDYKELVDKVEMAIDNEDEESSDDYNENENDLMEEDQTEYEETFDESYEEDTQSETEDNNYNQNDGEPSDDQEEERYVLRLEDDDVEIGEGTYVADTITVN